MKRAALLLIILLCVRECSALEDPPVGIVVEHNRNISASLMDNGEIGIGELSWEEPAKVRMRIIGSLPQVDYRIPADSEGILWAYDEMNANGSTNPISDAPSEQGCYTEYLFGPPSYGITNYSWTANISFTFRGETRSQELMDEQWGESWDEPDPIIQIPFSEAELETSNGTENLSVKIEWDFEYVFAVLITQRGPTEFCPSGSWVSEGVERETAGTVEADLIVESGEPGFFLARPALGEQWYLDNRFDNLIFSRKSIYKAEIWKDGNYSGYARIYNFTVLNDSLEAWHIFSSADSDFRNASMWGEELSYAATPVSTDNITYSHLYEANYSYSGWGPHNLTIKVSDFFGEEYAYGKEVVSRKLTHWGTSETGEEGDDALYYRPGEEYPEHGGLGRSLLPYSGVLAIFLCAVIWVEWNRRKKSNEKRMI